MSIDPQHRTTVEIARVLLRESFPGDTDSELLMFDYLAERYFRDPENPPGEEGERRQGGVGLSGEVLLTYVILAMVQAVLTPVVKGIGKGIEELTAESVKRLLRPHTGKMLKWLGAQKEEIGATERVQRLEITIRRLEQQEEAGDEDRERE